MLPFHNVNLSVNEIHGASCVPYYPLETRLSPIGVEMFFGSSIQIGEVCDFVFTEWEFSTEKLYLPVNSGIQAGDIQISYSTELLGPQPSVHTNLSLSQEVDQLMYIWFEGSLKAIWRSDFKPEKEIDLLYSPFNISVLELRGSKLEKFYVKVRHDNPRQSINYGFQIDPFFQEITQKYNTGSFGEFAGFAEFSESKNSYHSSINFPDIIECNYVNGCNLVTTSDPVFSLASSDTHQLVFGSMKTVDKLVVISDISQTAVGEIDVGSEPTNLEMSFDGETLMVWNSADQGFSIVNVASQSVTASSTVPEPLNALSPGADNTAFFSWSNTGTIYRMNYSDGQVSHQLNLGSGLKGISSNPEVNEVLAFYDNGQDTTLKILDGNNLNVLQTARIEGRVKLVPQFISGSFYRPDGNTAVAIPVTSSLWAQVLLLILITLGFLWHTRNRYRAIK